MSAGNVRGSRLAAQFSRAANREWQAIISKQVICAFDRQVQLQTVVVWGPPSQRADLPNRYWPTPLLTQISLQRLPNLHLSPRPREAGGDTIPPSPIRWWASVAHPPLAGGVCRRTHAEAMLAQPPLIDVIVSRTSSSPARRRDDGARSSAYTLHSMANLEGNCGRRKPASARNTTAW